MIIYIIISLFAFYGFFHLIRDITIKIKTNSVTCAGRLCLFPQPGDVCLESKIRCVFLDDISEKLGTDGCLYIVLEDNDPNRSLVERLACEYPRLVLLDGVNWSRMEGVDAAGIKN